MNQSVDILLATYQGEAFLDEQIASIMDQTYRFFHLYIRDDGSKDKTVFLLEQWQKKYPKKITLLHSNQNLGIKGNFSKLLASSTSDYIMLSDQDDVWFKDKVEKSVRAINALEDQKSPLLVHTDLKVVDHSLNELSASFWAYSRLIPERSSLKELLLQNTVTGCTTIFNRPLLEKCLPIPDEALMHDWWIALVAAAFGTISFIDQPTMLYRQHGHNDTGAKQYGVLNFLSRLIKEPKKSSLERNFNQAKAFFQRYEHRLTPEQKKLLTLFYSLNEQTFFCRKKTLFSEGFKKHGFLRNLNLYLRA